MGVFRRRKRAAQMIVLIRYQDLGDDRGGPIGERGYAHLWDLPDTPLLGQRVIVSTPRGESAGVIVGAGRASDLVGHAPQRVLRVATHAAIAAAQATRPAVQAAWLNAARIAAGLPAAPGPAAVPQGRLPIPPTTGNADADTARRRGDGWWTIYRSAQEASRPDEEVHRYKAIAEHWYAIRDGHEH